MANELQLSAGEAYDIADSFAQASARILDFRLSQRGALSAAESTELERCEDSLDHMVVLFRMKGTSPSRASRAPEGLRFTATQCHDGEVKLFINLF